jgi:polysaccharide export outer membrane protein
MTLTLLMFSLLFFQTPPDDGKPLQGDSPAPTAVSQPKQSGQPSEIPYALGAGDQIIVRAVGVEEFDGKTIPIDARGNIALPKVGRILAAGLSTEELEAEIERRLKTYVIEPDVTVYITELRSQPVSILGYVQAPGVHQLQGQKTLFEVLSIAGGLRPDAGSSIKISRDVRWGRIPLANAKDDATAQFSVASVDVKDVMSATNPAENIFIKPDDVITVPKGDMVYVVGAIKKPGGYLLGENLSISALQVLALAEGLDRSAATRDAKIMRTIPGSDTRAEIPVDLSRILANKINDLPLRANDILFIPTSAAKAAGVRTLEALIQAATMTAYRIP